MSLYRKYRPKNFADVYGQEHVVSTLEKAASNSKLVHAYLFAGSRGTGKTSVARILAKILMTRGVEDENIRKKIEKGVDDGSIVDLLEIDAASNTGVDNIRDLIEKIQFSPVVAAAKVYIIDEVHMLSKGAFNALLKTLEEPPEYAYFILATTELNKIPETVQSRCQCFPFRHIREEDIVRRLQYIADQERIVVDREALRGIAHMSEGGMRDAISLLDQMRSLEKVTLEEVRQRTGATGHAYVEEVLQAIGVQDLERVIACVSDVEEAGVPLDVFTRQLLNALRTKLHEHIKEKHDASALITMQEILLETIRNIRQSPVPGLALEAALLRLCGTGNTVAATMVKEVKRETKETRETRETGETGETREKTGKKSDVVAQHPALVEAPEVTLENMRNAWPIVLKEADPPSVKISLKNARLTSVEGSNVTLTFASAFHRDKVCASEASRTVEAILHTIFKRQLRLQCQLEEASKESEGRNEDIVNLADAAAEIF